MFWKPKRYAFAAIAAYSISAHAALWNFSYTFTDSITFEDGTRPRVVGSFTGDQEGPYIRNLANVQAVFYGSVFNAEQLLYGNVDIWNPTIGPEGEVPAVASRNLALNNFVFSSTRLPGGGFTIQNDPTRNFDRHVELWLPRITSPDTFGEDHNPGNWKLTRADVPEPGALTLLPIALAGLAISRRRKPVQS